MSHGYTTIAVLVICPLKKLLHVYPAIGSQKMVNSYTFTIRWF